jgi:multiple sugar transport system ATP-binding protein
MSDVVLQGVSKVYEGNVSAVREVNLTIPDKEFVVLVGPSGCGKSTVLRMIAGLEEISAGSILIDGKVVNNVAPKDRDIAMVFQNYALYPHMTVYQNLAFGLKLRKYTEPQIRTRVTDAARVLGIEQFLERKPKALSGGQRQRVALGRAIVRQPKVFLFDEPLSNLDANLRVQMRTEISRLHQKLKTTMIYVTHDQVEAMSMGDRIVVMKDGVVQQVDTPLNIYHNPVNTFVAGFIGSPTMNFFRGSISKANGGIRFLQDGTEFSLLLHPGKDQGEKKVILGIRPEHIFQSHPREGESVVPFPVHLEVIEPVGNEVFVYFTTGSDQQFVARFPSDAPPPVQTRRELFFDTTKAHLFDAETEQVLR